MKTVTYIGIAPEERERVERHEKKERVFMPLVDIGWSEEDCLRWCRKNNLLSPSYTDSHRSGCWFCPFQTVDSLRYLRKAYPDLWDILMRWDSDSPIPFKMNGITVHDYEERFRMEDAGEIDGTKRFVWNRVKNKNDDSGRTYISRKKRFIKRTPPINE